MAQRPAGLVDVELDETPKLTNSLGLSVTAPSMGEQSAQQGMDGQLALAAAAATLGLPGGEVSMGGPRPNAAP